MLASRKVIRNLCIRSGIGRLEPNRAFSTSVVPLTGARRRGKLVGTSTAAETQGTRNLDELLERTGKGPTDDGTKFDARIKQKVLEYQDLNLASGIRLHEDYATARAKNKYRSYYDLSDTLPKLRLVLAHLSGITPNNHLLNAPDGSVDEKDLLTSIQVLVPATSPRKIMTLDNLPLIPPQFETEEQFIEYLSSITIPKYVRIEKTQKHVIGQLVMDLLRPNSPDTRYRRTTKAYNIGLKYFVRIKDLSSVRLLVSMMASSPYSKPNTETYNIIFSGIPSTLIGSKEEYRRYLFNLYERQKLNKNFTVASETRRKATDSVYLKHPLKFMAKCLKDMKAAGLEANSETWNCVLGCAIGPVAKYHVLEYMHKLKIPLTSLGLKSVVRDLCDFLGPDKALALVSQDGFVLTVDCVKVIVERLIDRPSQSKLERAWQLLLTASSSEKGSVPMTTSVLNCFALRFARAGRIDWILGLMRAMYTKWGVKPNITTYQCLLEAVVRQPPHENKAFLLRVVYGEALKSWKKTSLGAAPTRIDAETLPAPFRTLIRRARAQFEFMAATVNKSNAATAERVTYRDPFGVDLAQYLKSPENVVAREFLDRASTLLAWPTTAGEPLRLTYPQQQQQPQKDHPISPELRDIVTKLGVTSQTGSVSRAVQKFERRPHDVADAMVPEWKAFLAARKHEYRSKLDAAEHQRRERVLENPYQSYIDSLKAGFAVEG